MNKSYPRVHVLVEGTTEETIVRDVVAPYLESIGWGVTTSTVITRRSGVGPSSRGGVSSWAKLRRQIVNLLGDTALTTLTTIFDYYGFPSDSPGMRNRPAGSALARVRHVERACQAEVGDVRFVPHLALHEVEAWVFVAAQQLADLVGNPALGDNLRKVVSAAGGAELINDGPATAPSKRIRKLYTSYSKPFDGPLAIAELGLGPLRAQCPHLDRWLQELECRVGGFTAH